MERTSFDVAEFGDRHGVRIWGELSRISCELQSDRPTHPDAYEILRTILGTLVQLGARDGLTIDRVPAS